MTNNNNFTPAPQLYPIAVRGFVLDEKGDVVFERTAIVSVPCTLDKTTATFARIVASCFERSKGDRFMVDEMEIGKTNVLTISGNTINLFLEINHATGLPGIDDKNLENALDLSGVSIYECYGIVLNYLTDNHRLVKVKGTPFDIIYKYMINHGYNNIIMNKAIALLPLIKESGVEYVRKLISGDNNYVDIKNIVDQYGRIIGDEFIKKEDEEY